MYKIWFDVLAKWKKRMSDSLLRLNNRDKTKNNIFSLLENGVVAIKNFLNYLPSFLDILYE